MLSIWKKMTKKERYSLIIKWFTENMPVAKSELRYKTAYELLVAVILSAQCTDKRVNQTPAFLLPIPMWHRLQSLLYQKFLNIFAAFHIQIQKHGIW